MYSLRLLRIKAGIIRKVNVIFTQPDVTKNSHPEIKLSNDYFYLTFLLCYKEVNSIVKIRNKN